MSESQSSYSQLPRSKLKSINILDTPIHAVSMSGALACVQRFMSEERLHQIATVNPEFVMAAQKDLDFQRVLEEADLCLPDGVGLLLASRWLGRPLPERVPGSEFVYHLAEMAAENKWRLFLLGAGPNVAQEAAAVFRAKYPKLVIAGAHAGTPDPADNATIVELINRSCADLLFVAYGAPKQDKWIAYNRRALTTVRVAVGVGGSLDFVAGRATRAPEWVQQIGLEWLHRLYKEPWRWHRMLALPRFVSQVLISGQRR